MTTRPSDLRGSLFTGGHGHVCAALANIPVAPCWRSHGARGTTRSGPHLSEIRSSMFPEIALIRALIP